jgi:hypothetical protein
LADAGRIVLEDPTDGWMKTIGGIRRMKYRGRETVASIFTLAAAAYNLIRLPKLLAEPG